MENGKRSAKEAFNRSVSSCQRLRHQEGATRDAPIISKHRADSAQLLGLSSSTICCSFPRYPRKQINSDNLIASIDQVGQKLIDYPSIVESSLTTLVQRRPPSDSDLLDVHQETPGVAATIHQDAPRGRPANQVGEWLAEAEARIMGEIPTTLFCFFLVLSSRS